MVEDDFKNALTHADLATKDAIIADGKIHRFHINGDKGGSKNGWYILYGDDIPAGSFGSWKTGEKHNWCNHAFKSLSLEERQRHQCRMREVEAQRKKEQKLRNKSAQEKAQSIWDDAAVCLSHPYLTNKQVKPFNMRVSQDKLLIPMRDAGGVLHSLQFIDADGNKRFLSGGRKKGCYGLIGRLAESLCIAEGYATAASIYDSVRVPVAVAFDAGNLEPVAKAIRKKFPNVQITICADNDAVGMSKARDAATAVNAKLAIPPIEGDFNDYYTGVTDMSKDPIKEASFPTETMDNAIERLAAMPALEYEQIRVDQAEKLNVRVGVLDQEIKKLRSFKEDEVHDDKFPNVEPWDEPVDSAELLDQINGLIRRFIICAPETSQASALWIAFTWIIEHVQVAPIANITAPEMQCGKSQLLSVISSMVKKPAIAANISPSVVFRVIEKYCPTLLIDEADSFMNGNDDLRGIINSGHTRDSAFVWRSVGDEHEPEQFSTWGAKAICGIGHQAATIMDRSIVLELRRKRADEQVERLRHADKSEFLTIRRKLARFAQDCGEQIAKARPDLPNALSDRAQDNWEPLLAIADVAGGHWVTTARYAALSIYAKSQDEDNQSAGIMLLNDIQSIFDDNPNYKNIFSADLLYLLCEMEERPWNDWNKGRAITTAKIARYLKPYGVHPKTIREGYKTAKGYERKAFNDAFDRYIPSQNATASQANEIKVFKGNERVTNDINVTDQNTRHPAENIDCYGVTLSQGDVGKKMS